MRKISVRMLALMLALGVMMLASCKKAEETEDSTGEPMAETRPPPAIAEPSVGAPPAPEARSRMSDNTAASSAPTAPALVDKALRSVRLFYGTNRARDEECVEIAASRWDSTSRCRPNSYYTGLPADASGATGGLEVGTVAVTFPPIHEPGKIERPLEVFSFSVREEDPDKDVVVSELRSFGADEAAWAGELRATGRDQAFIYVHGFETSFDQAVRRAAQLAYDLDFDLAADFRGVPMLFSWPSRGGLRAYGADYDASFEATDAFNRFLDVVKQQAGIRRVHVIAHSMGNRVVAEALLARGTRAEPILDQLVLAAPDIWASRFKNKFLHTLPQLASRVTLYVSDQDRALVASRDIREGEPRAGQVAGGLLMASRGVDRFDAIDASSLRNDFLGHSYYASSPMLGDIYCLLKGAPARSRPLLVVAHPAWRFRPAEELALWRGGACIAAAAAMPSLATPARSSALFPGFKAVVAVLLVTTLFLAVLLRRRHRR